jgi:hypothetical protein
MTPDQHHDPDSAELRERIDRGLREAETAARQAQLMLEGMRACAQPAKERDVLALQIRLDDLRIMLVDLMMLARSLPSQHEEGTTLQQGEVAERQLH